MFKDNLLKSALDAQRQSTLQQQYEPYQRAEFLANLYAAGPKSSSQVTMGTQPSTSPLAQAVGTGIGAFTAFQGVKPTGTLGGLMSLNKVLNRPMFRKEALRKGVLKTINANTGIMVGSPILAAPVPAIRKPPTFMERMTVSSPARFGKNLVKGIANIPAAGGYIAGEKVADALDIKDPVGRMAFGLGGSYVGVRALPALAGIGALPSAVIGAAAYGAYDRTKAGIELRKKINAMSPEERADFRDKID